MYFVGIDIAKRFHEAAVIYDAVRKLNQLVEFAMEATGHYWLSLYSGFSFYTNTEILPENIHALRELCRHRFYVVDTASDIKRKVLALLDQVFLEYEKLFTVTYMQLVANYSTPEQMLSVDSQTLADLLQKASRGGLPNSRVRQKFFRHYKTLAAVIFSEIVGDYFKVFISAETCCLCLTFTMLV